MIPALKLCVSYAAGENVISLAVFVFCHTPEGRIMVFILANMPQSAIFTCLLSNHKKKSVKGGHRPQRLPLILFLLDIMPEGKTVVW